MISLYLSRSLRRKPLRHIALAWIMLCAFLLPLVVSTYRDSLEYGGRLQLHDISKEYAFHIVGAAPEDAELFSNIGGLTDPFYEDGTIYLSYISREFWETANDLEQLNSMSDEEMLAFLAERQRISDALDSAMAKSSRALHLEVYSSDMWREATEGSSLEAHIREMWHLNIALLLFSGGIVYSAYRNHITEFSRELETLELLGATRGQKFRLFLAELMVLFPLAAAGAVGLSWLVMGFLYRNFLGNTASSVTVWEVFHMDARNTALEILFYFLVCLAAMLVSVLRSPAKREWKIKAPRRTASLPMLWVQRTRPPFFRCVLILVPLLTVSILLFNRYLGTYAQRVYSTQNAQITVTSNWGFSQWELDAVHGLNGIQSIQEVKNNQCLMAAPEGGSLTAAVHSYRDCPTPLSAPADTEMAAALPSGGTVGDAYYLLNMQTQASALVTLTQLLPVQGDNPYTVDIYVSDALMLVLVENAPVTTLEICTTAQGAAALEAELNHILPDSTVSNSQNGVDTDIDRQIGRLLLLCWIFCILMLAAMQIIWARLCGYVRVCGPMLRIVSQVGGSRRQLEKLVPAWIGGVIAAVLSFAIAIPWAMRETAQANRPFIISIPVLVIYLAITVLVTVTFLLPVKTALKRVLKTAE